MPVCDGVGCNAEIPWKIAARKLEFGNAGAAFNLDEVRAALEWVIRFEYGGCTAAVAVGGKLPKLVNLCAECWRKQANSWPNPETYVGVRARTTEDGLFFRVNDQVFFRDRLPNPEAILSCVVHELMHFWSCDCTGLQNFNRTINVDWDEATADMLGYMTYRRCFKGRHKKYVTPYNQYPTCIEQIGTQVAVLAGYKWNSITGNAAYQQNLPRELRDFVQNKPLGISDTLYRLRIMRIAQEVVFDGLVTGFMNGPNAVAPSVGMPMLQFLSDNGIKAFVNTMTAFPAYGVAGEVEHPI